MDKRYLLPAALITVLILAGPAALAGAATPPAVTVNPIDLTPFFQALIGLLATIVTAKLVPWIAARTTTQQRESMTALIRTLVYAAEQLYATDQGIQKFAYVRAELMRRGYAVDAAAIEAAVRQLKLAEWIAEPDGE